MTFDKRIQILLNKSNGVKISNLNVMATKVNVIFSYRILVKFGDIWRHLDYISTLCENLNFRTTELHSGHLPFLSYY